MTRTRHSSTISISIIMVSISQTLSQKCNFACITCSPTGNCLSCAAGYKIDQGACKKIGPAYCIEANTENICTKCRPGFRLEQGNCIICSVSGCKDCNTNQNGCDICYEGKFFKSGNCNSVCSVGNCSLCASRIDRCDTCLEGFRLNSAKTACEPCGIQHCKSCNIDSRICTECITDYFLDGENCTLCPFGCGQCTNSTSCQQCDERFGYYMRSDLTCSKASYAIGISFIGITLFILVNLVFKF